MKLAVIFAFIAIIGCFVFLKGRPGTPMIPTRAEFGINANATPESVAANSEVKIDQEGISASLLPIDLIGTIIRADSSKSLATIKFKSAENSENYLLNNEIREFATVTSIERDRIIFRNRKSRALEFIKLGPFDPFQGISSASRDAQSRDIQVDRKFVDASLAQLSTFINDAGTAPVLSQSGQITGFRMTFVKPGSIYEKLGIKMGDVLRNVNGTDLNSAETAIELFNQLRASSMIKLKVERGAGFLDLTYLIR